jgi:hypothetical protein
VSGYLPDLQPYHGNLWRLIEGQARSSTIGIVDTLAEHEVLEAILESSKPPVPLDCRHLDYQLWSPFRYGRYPRDSRFRRAGPTPGVWYGAETVVTALVECIWGNLRFYAASPGTPYPRRPVAHTAVKARIATPFSADLTTPDAQGRGRWADPDDYADCLALADRLRAAGGEAIRYRSVRDPGAGANVAVLTCRAFAAPRPVTRQNWLITLRPGLVRAQTDQPGAQHMFAVGAKGLVAA